MSFSRVNSLGWALYEVLTSTQMNSLDIDHANAIDGAAGGSYDPSSPVVFGAGKIQISPDIGDVEYQDDAYPKLTSRTAQSVHHINPYSLTPAYLKASGLGGSADFYWYDSIIVSQQWRDTGATRPGFYAPFVPPVPYGTLSTLDLWLIGASGHGANLPALMPRFTLYRISSTGSRAQVAQATDTTATVGEYEVGHAIHLLSIGETIDASANYLYEVYIEGEVGNYSLTGTEFIYLKSYCVVDTIYPENYGS